MPNSQVIDVNRLIDERNVSAFNILIVALCFLTMAFDGYDLAVMGLAAPGLVGTWHVSPAALGPVFSASLFGMLFGAPIFAYVGDRFGRRNAMIWCTIVYGIFTLFCSQASSLNELMILRFLTGFGLGGLPPNAIALNAEYAPKHARALLIVSMHVGSGFGGVAPSLIVAAFVPSWQTLFLIGGLGPLAVCVLLFFLLPESIKYFAMRHVAREKMVRLAKRLRPDLEIAPNAQFVIPTQPGTVRGGFRPARLFSNGLAWITLLIWLLYILDLTVNYFLKNWMPLLFRGIGLSDHAMGLTTAMYPVGGAVGAIVLGYLVTRGGVIWLAAFFVLACPFTALIGVPDISVVALGALVFMVGFFVVGVEVGLGAIVGSIYPTEIRATATGWASSIGRFGAMSGPMIAAVLVGMHTSVSTLFLAPLLPYLIGATAAFALAQLCIRRFHGRQLDESRQIDENLQLDEPLSVPQTPN